MAPDPDPDPDPDPGLVLELGLELRPKLVPAQEPEQPFVLQRALTGAPVRCRGWNRGRCPMACGWCWCATVRPTGTWPAAFRGSWTSR